MKLVLDEKTYHAPTVKAKMFRKALVLSKENNFDEIDADMLDNLLFFVVEAFGNQFSLEDIYENLASKDLIPLILETVEYVVGKEEDYTKKNKAL